MLFYSKFKHYEQSERIKNRLMSFSQNITKVCQNKKTLFSLIDTPTYLYW